MATEPDDLAALAKFAPALLWMSDLEGGGTRFNASWLEFTGLKAEEARGDGWIEAVHPDDRPQRLAVLREAAARQEPFETEYRLRRHDGMWRWVLDRGVPQTEPAMGYAGACFDVTERRGQAEDLLRSEEDLRLALAAGKMGTWVWDRRSGGVTRDANLQALYGLGSEPAVTTFDEWLEMVHPDDLPRLLDEVERALTEGSTYDVEHRLIRPDGEVRWLARRGAVYFDDKGEIGGTRGMVVDITDTKRAEEERNRLLAAEQAARREAEMAARRLARLHAVTAGLSDARTLHEAADVIVAQGIEGVDAASGALCLLIDGGDQLEVIRHVGYSNGTMERFQIFSPDDNLPASDALRTGEMVLLGSLEERDARYPSLRGVHARNISHAVIPLLVNKRPLGAISLGWQGPRHFDEHDKGFLTALGQQAAQALDRAQFYDAERSRAKRQGFLADASRVLGSSFDYQWALGEIAHMAVPDVADACSIHLINDADLCAVAMVGTDMSAEALQALAPLPWCFAIDDLLEIATKGDTVLLSTVDDELCQAWAEDDRHLAVIERVAGRSAMAVPMRTRGEALGVVVMTMGHSGRRLGPVDVAFVEDLADRAAAAIANSRSHLARTAIAQTLQHSLLPPEIPILPGLEVAARYRPVGDEVEVGGDFYDVFAAGGGRWGVVIGDVSGKGVRSASLTALARYTVRAASRGTTGPSGVLEVLNNSILDDGGGERFCTVALAFLRYDAAGAHFTLSCGGQPLPLLVDRRGEVRSVGQCGSAIGLFGNPDLTDVSTLLGPEEMLVLYTDGVVEARSPSGAFADGLLEATLRSCAGEPAEIVADAVEAALRDFIGGMPRDDTAILVIRRPPGMFHEHITPGPKAVPRTRQRLREWLDVQLAIAPELAGDVLLVANELITNAERVARAGLDIHVSVDVDKVTIDVSDDGPGFGGRIPPLTAPPDHAMAGRGLFIVNRLSDQCIVRAGSAGTLVRSILYRPLGSLGGPR